MGYILIGVTALVSILCSYITQKKQRASKEMNRISKSEDFYIDANNPTMSAYVSNMELQHKSNSRALDGTGKMHYVEVLASGSDLIKRKDISVLRNLGDRFS